MAGWGSAMKEYTHLLAEDPAYADRARAFAERVRDLSKILVALGGGCRTLLRQSRVAPRHPLPLVAAYNNECHLAQAQGVRSQPRRRLTDISGPEEHEIADPEICCGSAGVYNVLNPERARELGHRNAAAVLATGAEVLVTANPGCLTQVASALDRAGGSITLAHTVEVLDASIRGDSLSHSPQ
jgi:glycolate oxidase iron-sulfur subunit